MCHLHSWSGFDLDLWPQGQIWLFYLCLFVQPINSVCFDIGIPYLAHGSITMRGCVAYINDPDRALTFDLKVQFIEFMTWLCVWATALLSFEKVILCLEWEVYHHGTMCWVHSLPLYDLNLWPQFQNYIITINLSLAKSFLLFDIGIPNSGKWVYYFETTCCVNSSFVWPWPLTYIWMTGVS